MSQSPKDFNNPNRVTLTEADVSGLGQAILALTQEIWVMSDRMRVMEAVLAQRGINISDDIDQFQPDEAFQNTLNESGKDLVSRIVKALAPTPSEGED